MARDEPQVRTTGERSMSELDDLEEIDLYGDRVRHYPKQIMGARKGFLKRLDNRQRRLKWKNQLQTIRAYAAAKAKRGSK